MTLLGAALLWFGWFGFNAGSELAADGIAANAFVVTNTAAAAGALAWMVASWIQGKPATLGIVSGAIAGLVAITPPAAGFVDVTGSLVIGALAGLVCYAALLWRQKKKIDESLDAWAIHGGVGGGVFGALATGLLATAAIGGVNGLFYGNANQFLIQLLDVVVAVATPLW